MGLFARVWGETKCIECGKSSLRPICPKCVRKNTILCVVCNGKGHNGPFTCGTCKGEGRVRAPKN